MRYILLALLTAFLAFLPFHLMNSPEGGKIEFIRIDPRGFDPPPP